MLLIFSNEHTQSEGHAEHYNVKDTGKDSQPHKEIICQLFSLNSRMVLVEEKNLTMPYKIRQISFFMHMQDVAHPHKHEVFGSFIVFNMYIKYGKL